MNCTRLLVGVALMSFCSHSKQDEKLGKRRSAGQENEGICEPGWTEYKHHCYKLNSDELDWTNAEKSCNDMGASLVYIEDSEENEWLADLCPDLCWIGFNDKKQEDQWVWSHYTATANYTAWYTGEPNNLNVEDCGVINGAKHKRRKWGLKWNDLDCNHTIEYICKKTTPRMISRKCRKDGFDGTWLDPSFTNCTREKIAEIQNKLNRIKDGVLVDELVNVIREFRNTFEEIMKINLTASDIRIGVQVLATVSEIVTSRKEDITVKETQEFIKATDVILSGESKDSWQSLYTETKDNGAARVMDIVGNISNRAMENLVADKPISVNGKNIVLLIEKTNISSIVFPKNETSEITNKVELSEETIKNSLKVTTGVRYSAAYYKTLGDFLPNSLGEEEIGSTILSFSLPKGDILRQLDPPIQMTLKTKEEIVNLDNSEAIRNIYPMETVVVSEASGLQTEDSIARNRPRRHGPESLMQFTEDEDQLQSEDEETELFKKPKAPAAKRVTKKKGDYGKFEIELEREKLALEREKLAVELERLAVEKEKLRLQAIEKDRTSDNLPLKVKLQPFDPKHDDILTFLSEFDAVSDQAKWNDNMRLLQLRTLLNGNARQVSSQCSTSYTELKKALIDRYARRPHEYFMELMNIKREQNETYRALMARITMDLDRCVRDKNPIQCLREEFFLKALPATQAQWIRRNKGLGSVVEAAEDYIVPQIPKFSDNDEKHYNSGNNNDNNKKPEKQKDEKTNVENVRCFKCNETGHFANRCVKGKINLAFSFTNVRDGLLYIPGKVNRKEVSFVKDTGASITLLREDLVDQSCVLDGQKTTLYTAIGQPFEAKLAVVNLETPYFKGHAQVGLVPNLMSDALLGMDVLNKQDQQVQNAKTNDDIKVIDISSINAGVLSGMQRDDPSLGNCLIENETRQDQNVQVAGTNDDIKVIDISRVNAGVLSGMQKDDPSVRNCLNEVNDHETRQVQNVQEAETNDDIKVIDISSVHAGVLSEMQKDKPLILQIDVASIGAVRSQTLGDSVHRVVYASKQLLPREQNSTFGRNYLAIVWVMVLLSYYLDGRHFTIETDHNPLTWLNKIKDRYKILLRWSLG